MNREPPVKPTWERESREVFEEYFRELFHPVRNANQHFDPEFEEIARDCLARAARRLYTLPLDDPFWEDPRVLNPQTTWDKVYLYHLLALERDPGDEEARWVRISALWRSVGMYSNSVPIFMPLIERDRSALRWLINATRNLWFSAGQAATPFLREVLDATARQIPDLRESLEEMVSHTDGAVRNAAEAALLVLDGERLPEEEKGGEWTEGRKP